MRPTNDQPTTDQQTDQRVTVTEAAALLGLSEDAVRSRLKRGTLRKEKASDGTVLVVLGEDRTANRPTNQVVLVEVLREQVAYLREQLDQERETNHENRRIIAGLVQRLPELEAAQEPRDSPEPGSEAAGEGESAQEPSKRHSWLYRFFFGP